MVRTGTIKVAYVYRGRFGRHVDNIVNLHFCCRIYPVYLCSNLTRLNAAVYSRDCVEISSIILYRMDDQFIDQSRIYEKKWISASIYYKMINVIGNVLNTKYKDEPQYYTEKVFSILFTIRHSSWQHDNL